MKNKKDKAEKKQNKNKEDESIPIQTENENEDSEQDKIDNLREKVEEYQDKYLKLAAEFENYKKRQSRIFDEMVNASRDSMILKILDILDNFERAIESKEQEYDVDSILEGLHLIHKQILSMLADENIVEICPEGEEFDPNFHEAISAIISDYDENKITNVIQKGYICNERLIRPAKVVVSKGKKQAEEDD